MPSADSLRRAADLLAAGDWEGAHAIVQDDPFASRGVHARVVHLLESDVSNARYWHGCAGRAFPDEGAVQREAGPASGSGETIK
jgi:hypothetical protein